MTDILASSMNDKVTEKKSKRKFPFVIIVFLLIVGIAIFIKLNINKDSVKSVTYNNDEVMIVKGQRIKMDEFLLYAADVYQGYNLQKEANWDKVITDSGNKTITFEEQVKGTICEQIRMTKILCMKAKDQGVSLSDDEKKILLINAQTYYKDLTSANVIDKALTVDLITKFYEENALAQKVYNSIIDGYDENKNTSANDTKDTELTEKEAYFVEIYHKLEEKYDKNYDYDTSINWDLLKQVSFSKISKDDSAKSGTADIETK